jgi:hypothetical protein
MYPKEGKKRVYEITTIKLKNLRNERFCKYRIAANVARTILSLKSRQGK